MTDKMTLDKIFVIVLGVTIIMTIWFGTTPAGRINEQTTSKEGIQEAVRSDAEADGGRVPQSDSGGSECHGIGGESGAKTRDSGAGSYTAGSEEGCGDGTGALGDGTEAIDESSANEKARFDRQAAVLEGHVAVDDRGSLDEDRFPAIPEPEKEEISEPSAGEEASEEAATDAAKRAGNISHDNKDGLFVLGEVAEDMPADETDQDLAEVGGKIQSDGTGSTSGQLYSVNRAILSPYLQEYLYGQLARYGCEWFFPVALCQIYQESRFRSDAVNPNGLDKGLCQFREQYWEYHARLSGLYEYDIWNPIDQLWVYSWLMSENLRKSGGDVGMALSRYYLGEATYCEKYVLDVMQWMQTMEVR